MRILLSTLVVATFVVATNAQERATRSVERSGISFRMAADSERPGYDAMNLPDGQMIYVSRKPLASAADVMHAEKITKSGMDTVQIDLSKDAADRVEKATSAGIGSRVAVLVDGTLVTAPVIASAITGGRMQISGLVPSDLDRVVRQLSARDVAPRDGVILVPSATSVAAGGTFTVDVFAQNVASMRGYQITLDTIGGDAGSVRVENVEVKTGRGDYIFGGTQSYQAFNVEASRLANVLPAGSIDGVGRVYLGTYAFVVSADAKGTFQVAIVNRGKESVLLDAYSEPMDVNMVAQTAITIR